MLSLFFIDLSLMKFIVTSQDMEEILSTFDHPYKVVISSYSKLTNNSKFHDSYKKIKWEIVILDEKHNIRNPTSDRYAKVMELQQKSSVILTGIL